MTSVPEPGAGSVRRAARIASLALGIAPILFFLGLTIHLLIAKYRLFDGLAWFDFRMAFAGQLLIGLLVGGPLLLARFAAERKPLVGAIIMLVLAIPFICIPIVAGDTENWAASIGLIYIVPALLYLVSWRRRRL